MSNNGSVSLFVSAPVCSFRKGYAREYLETEEMPPPSTIYGFLLALIGEEDRHKYLGTELAYAILTKPELSVVMRTAWRMKNKNVPPGVGQNRRPDFQEILTGVEILVCLKPGKLADRINKVQTSPRNIKRYGGLSLGESRDLINDILWNPDLKQETGQWLTIDSEGEFPLPVWVDHVGSKKTIWRQFSLKYGKLDQPSKDDPRWIIIQKNSR